MSTHPLLTRRSVMCAATAVLGTVLLALSIGSDPGEARFYPLALALAATWAAGAALSGPIPLWRAAPSVRSPGSRPVRAGVLTGIGMSLLCAAGAWVLSQLDPLRDAVVEVIDIAQEGSYLLVVLVALVTGAAEELFFRGALYDAVRGWHPVEVTAAAYALITVATGNVMLIFAALLLGLVTGRQRHVTGGIVAPMMTHVTWSLGMVTLLPAVLEVTS